MTVSKLAARTIPSPNRYSPRTARVEKVTIHHMAGALTAAQCGAVFASSARQASSNYGIGVDGEIVCYVPEEDAAWTSSSYWNDNRAVTIEVANSPAGVASGTWAVSAAAWRSMIALCADICARYGIEPSYTGGKDGTFTEHMMFAPTGCPGPYIHSRMAEIVKQVKTEMREDIDMAIGNDIMSWLKDTSDASGRGKKANFKDRLAWMAAKQEAEIEARKVQDQKIDAISAKLDKIAAKLK